MNETPTLNEIKSLILAKTGISIPTPCDCKRISLEISKTLGKNLSETTIKRLFGFANAKHSFSKFTVTTLAEFVSDQHAAMTDKGVLAANDGWQHVRDKASAISSLTVKTFKNRSSIPYELTVPRKFSEEDFDLFLASEQSYMCFISQPGYGKSIILTQLAERFLTTPAYEGNPTLFITAHSFFSEGFVPVSLGEHIKSLLGIPSHENLATYITRHLAPTKGKFVIFMDGFSDHEFTNDLKTQVFEGLINFLCTLENVPHIKVVFAMRSATWIRFYNKVRHSSYLKKKWFQGSFYNSNEVSNVPLLTGEEVDQLLSRINLAGKATISPELKAQLKFPFHIPFLYQLKDEDSYFSYFTSVISHELVSRFVYDKIYLPGEYTQKLIFFRKIITVTDYGKLSAALKDELLDEIRLDVKAYAELLSDGILIEETEISDRHPKEYIRFVHPHIFEYFLFLELLEKFTVSDGKAFFEFVSKTYTNNQTRFELYQWMIRYLVRNGELSSLRHLFKTDLDSFEKNYLILFIAESLYYRSKSCPDTYLLIDQHDLHDIMLNQLMHFDLVDSMYREAIIMLLQITENPKYLTAYHSILLIFDLLTSNVRQITFRGNLLEGLQPQSWPANPAKVSLNALDHMLGNAGEINFIDDLRNTMPLRDSAELTWQEGVQYTLAIMLSLFYSEEEMFKTLKHLFEKRRRLFSRRTPFTIFNMSVFALVNSWLRPDHPDRLPMEKSKKLERILFMLDQGKLRFRITNFTAANIKLMYAISLKDSGQFEAAHRLCLECMEVYKRNRLNLSCLFTYRLIIKILIEKGDFKKVEEYNCERHRFIEENGISGKLQPFMNESIK
ncbi:hypothetical protein [Pedobacter deserti]|uniref:hypothetical protein n=1 Tax=Pedobacter deserti TaxID=2817382 RepID=UPI00210C152D|nr:hypothetical protein [Pedobacter sp. SYSU D00382]